MPAAHRYVERHAPAVRCAGFKGEGADLGEAGCDAIVRGGSGTLISTHLYEDTWRFIRHADRRVHLDIPDFRPRRGALAPRASWTRVGYSATKSSDRAARRPLSQGAPAPPGRAVAVVPVPTLPGVRAASGAPPASRRPGRPPPRSGRCRKPRVPPRRGVLCLRRRPTRGWASPRRLPVPRQAPSRWARIQRPLSA